jgi:thiol:disulfide interchange protein DsbC
MPDMLSRRRFSAALALSALPLRAFAQGGPAWSSLPFQWSITHTYGKPRAKIAVFSDPRCPYCRRFEADLAKIGDLTVHVFPLAVLGPDSVRIAKGVWCAPDRAKAWDDALHRRIAPPAAQCDDPIESLISYARQNGVRVTPTWFLESGERYIGAMPIDGLTLVLGR